MYKYIMKSDTGLLTREEYEAAHSMEYVNKVRNLLKSLNTKKFSVGDYINCLDKKRSRLEYASEQMSSMPAIYRVVCIDDMGLVFVRKACLKGDFHKKIECISMTNTF